MSRFINTRFQLFKSFYWLEQASYWQLPPQSSAPADQDAFMMGGNGCLSARMGMQPAFSTIDRIMGPEFDSYGYLQNNYFRKSDIGVALRWPHMMKSWISIDWPYQSLRVWQQLWRVPHTAILCTAEELQVEDKDGIWAKGIQVATINFVLPDQPVLLRLLALRNGGENPLLGVRLVMDAPPDVPWPDVGHNSTIHPLGERLIETVTEYELVPSNTVGWHSSEQIERVRFCLRGLVGGNRRGIQNLASPAVNLEPGDEITSLAYLIVSPDNSQKAAENIEKELLEEVKSNGIYAALDRTYNWWQEWHTNRLAVQCPDERITDFLDAALVAQKQAQHECGGIMVGDDYTASFVRDCNGSHLLLGATDHEAEVLKSMEFYFMRDTDRGSFDNSYRMDLESHPVDVNKPYWYQLEMDTLAKQESKIAVQGDVELARKRIMTPGDVPNFRVLWYWWYHLQTGDLKLVSERWMYLSSLIRLQRFEQSGFLNCYSQDETYGIGPAGALRQGKSADNSFIALAAVQAMAVLAERLQKSTDAEYFHTLASRILETIEKTFWMNEDGYYAMRLTPEGVLDNRPCTPGLLRPLWVGCHGLDANHVAGSVDYVLNHLKSSHGFMRIIPEDFWMTPGNFPGYLLIDLCKLNHPEVNIAFSDLLEYINPGGTCAEYYMYKEQQIRADIHRSRNWETGINAHSVLFYLTGFEPDAYLSQFDLSPHLPPGWDRFIVKSLPVGNSKVDLEMSQQVNGFLYKISLHGHQAYNFHMRCPLPMAWIAGKVLINGQPTTQMTETNCYGLQVLYVEHSIAAEQIIQIQLVEDHMK